MKLNCIIIFIAVLLQNGSAQYFTWKTEEISLKTTIPEEIKIIDNRTEYVISPSRDLLEELGREPYSIYVWIKDMSCLKYKPGMDGPDYSLPNYIKISSESSEVVLKPWTVCENITGEETPKSAYNNMFHNIGLNKIKITPIGEYWSPKTAMAATFSVEIKKHKIIQISDETPQMDINVIPETTYSVMLNEKNTLCTREDDYSCSLLIAVSKMECYSPNYLEILKEVDGSKNVEEVIEDTFCESGINFHPSSEVTFFESNKKMVFKTSGEFNTRLSITLVLNSTKSDDLDRNHCPSGYFDCNYDGKKCISEDWTCDGRPNCPSQYSAPDERDCRRVTDEYYYYCTDDFNYFKYMLISFLLVLFGISVIVVGCRYIMLSSRTPRRDTTGIVHQSTLPPPTYHQAIQMQVKH